MATHTIELESEVDWEGFRTHARRLVLLGAPPPDVSWQVATAAEPDLFGSRGPVDGVPDARGSDAAGGVPGYRANGTSHARQHAGAETPRADSTGAPSLGRTDGATFLVPRAFVTLCQTVILHQDRGRFGLLYRLLWRLQHEAGLRDDPLDPDAMQAERLARAVRRDQHKMKAFVRFRPITRDDGSILHVAWFEPEHHIVEATAPFFMRRFTHMHWAILTPECSARWDGERLEIGLGAARDDAPPADAGEALWLTYYSSIFNPARLKVAMMQKEMPRKYWHNLPEAKLIAPLTASAHQRSTQMIDAPASQPKRRIVPMVIERDELFGPQNELDDVSLNHSPAKALDQFKRMAQSCRDCPIGEHATQAVWGEGPAHARIMIVGEQPGDYEDLRGRPFVGPAGQLFDRAMTEVGWPRDEVYVTNAVKHFKFEPRGKRRIHKTPTQQEAATCMQWLEREIATVRPQALVALGATAARALLGRHVAVMRERGHWMAGPHGIPVLVTVHPSALLRTDDSQKAAAYAAWLTDLRVAVNGPTDGQQAMPPVG